MKLQVVRWQFWQRNDQAFHWVKPELTYGCDVIVTPLFRSKWFEKAERASILDI